MDIQVTGGSAAALRLAPARSEWGDRLRSLFPAPFTIVTVLIAALAAALIFAPVLIMFKANLFPGWELNTKAFIDTFSRSSLYPAFRNSLLLVIAVNLTAVPLGVLFAWLNYRTDAKMGMLATLLPMLPLFLPSVALTIGWVFLGSDQSGFLTNAMMAVLRAVGIELSAPPIHVFSWGGMIFVYAIEIMPVVYVLTASAYRSVDPSLEEAARINGSGVFKTFITVSIPVVRHAILLSMLLASVLAMGIYSVPAIIGSPARIPTLSVHLVRLLNGEYPPKFAETAVLSLVLIVIFGSAWVMQQRINASGRHAQIGGQ